MSAGLALFLVFVMSASSLLLAGIVWKVDERDVGHQMAASALFGMGCVGMIVVADRLMSVANGWPL